MRVRACRSACVCAEARACVQRRVRACRSACVVQECMRACVQRSERAPAFALLHAFACLANTCACALAPVLELVRMSM
eukprot:2919560-Pleurochrysis_carterae.AAC.1